MSGVIGKLVGWLANAARQVNRVNAEMRNPDVRGRYSSPGPPEEPEHRRRQGESNGEQPDPGKPEEESGKGRSG